MTNEGEQKEKQGNRTKPVLLFYAAETRSETKDGASLNNDYD